MRGPERCNLPHARAKDVFLKLPKNSPRDEPHFNIGVFSLEEKIFQFDYELFCMACTYIIFNMYTF